MGLSFYHGFKKGLGPFTHRETGRTFPTGNDCVRRRDGYVSLGVRTNPLRTGHIYVPPDEFQVTLGFVETRARFRGSPGAHGSVWLQALTPYNSSVDHEIDVVENFGNKKKVHQGIWTQMDEDIEPEQILHAVSRIPAREYHVYGCEMRSDGYTFTIDDYEVVSTKLFTSTEPKYLIASMLISDWEYTKYGLGNAWDQRIHIDWIRVSDLEVSN